MQKSKNRPVFLRQLNFSLQNPKRGEIQATYNLFLDTASGFFLQLLQEICSAFRLDLPMRKKALRYGILSGKVCDKLATGLQYIPMPVQYLHHVVLSEFKKTTYKMKLPKKGSCMYICQYCLIHLGDIGTVGFQVRYSNVNGRLKLLMLYSSGLCALHPCMYCALHPCMYCASCLYVCTVIMFLYVMHS